MAIKFKMFENHLKPGTYYARVIHGKTVYLDNLIPSITEKTTLTEIDIKGVVRTLAKEGIEVLLNGDSLAIDGLVTFSLSLSGSFDRADEVVTRDNIVINVLAQEAPLIEKSVTQNAVLERLPTTTTVPIIAAVYDAGTEVADIYSSGSIIQLTGENLKFDRTQPDEGVFVNDGTTETRLSVYSLINSKNVHALVPASITGPITVHIRVRHSPNGKLHADVYNHTVEQSAPPPP